MALYLNDEASYNNSLKITEYIIMKGTKFFFKLFLYIPSIGTIKSDEYE